MEFTTTRLPVNQEKDVWSRLDALERDGSLFEEEAFIERSETIDLLQVHIIDRLQYLALDPHGWADFTSPIRQAEALVDTLELVNQHLVQRILHEVRSGNLLRFHRLVRACIRHSRRQRMSDQDTYDVLDTLIGALLAVEHTSPEETVAREAEMTFYQPTPARMVWELVSKARITRRDVFYDLGSGLGQVAILVNLLSGASARGIEVEPSYHRYARLSLRKLLLEKVEFIHGDARAVDFSGGTVFYLYTPFQGKILRDVLDKLEREARKRIIRVCTYGPCTLVVGKENWLRAVGSGAVRGNGITVFRSTI